MDSKRESIWNCDYCVSKNLQQVRNCDCNTTGTCQNCGDFQEDECSFDENTGRYTCPNCNGKMRWFFELRLGSKWTAHYCPIRIINPTTIFLVKLVNWSESVKVLPAPGGLLGQTNLFFEIRNFIINEKAMAEEELSPKEPTPAVPSPAGVTRIPRKPAGR